MGRSVAVHTEIVAPERLAPQALEYLIDELYAVHTQVYAGVSRDAFAADVVLPPSRTRIAITRVLSGAAVGYTASHLYYARPETSGVAVMRSERSYLPAYRDLGLGRTLLFKEALRFRSLNPLTPLVGLCCPVDPAAYVALGRSAAQLWPHPKRRMPARVQRLMGTLSSFFTLPTIDGRPGVRHIGWITRSSTDEAARWARSTDTFARYFHAANPVYAQGSGLLTVVPLSLGNLLLSGARSLARLARLGRGPGAHLGTGLETQTGGLHEARPSPCAPVHTHHGARLLR